MKLLLALALLGAAAAHADDACAALEKRAAIACYGELAWKHCRAVEYDKALDAFGRARTISHEIGDRASEAGAINFIGLVHQFLNQPEVAIEHYRRALAMARQIGDRRVEGLALYHLGWVHFVQQRNDAALKFFAQSLAIRRETGDRNGEALTLMQIGMTYSALGRYGDALAIERQALPLVREFGERGREADVLDHIGLALTALHRGEEAIANHQRALEIRKSLGDGGTTTFTLSSLARAHESLGRTKEAAEEMKQVIDLLETRRGKMPVAPLRGSMFAGMLGHYAHTIDLLMALRDEEAAFDLSERARARLTLDAVLRTHSAQPFPLKTIRERLLDSDTAIVEYFLGPQKSYVWTVTRDAIATRELPPRATIESAAASLHALLSAGDQRARQHDLDAALRRMSSMLAFDPPRGVDRVIVVPDGALFNVPFAALLADRYQLAIAPSASALVLLGRSDGCHCQNVAVFADPLLRDMPRLASTRAEADAIATFARGTTRKAIGIEASRRTLLSEDLGRYRVVHFATHALIDTQQPERSGIALTDGFVRIDDLDALHGAPELVVLSACRTAAGKELRGEGIVGLVSGFMHAGTPRVVASYWNVKDAATAEIMKRFYRAMFVDGASPAAALRIAQRSMRADPRWKSPYYWASFALYGLP